MYKTRLKEATYSNMMGIEYCIIILNLQIFAIKFVTFVIDFVSFAVEFVTFAIGFDPFAIIEFVSFAVKFVTLTVALDALEQDWQLQETQKHGVAAAPWSCYL